MEQEAVGFDLLPLIILPISILPLIILSIPIWIVCIRLARRKGMKVTIYALFGWIPIINFALAAYLVGHTDKAVYDKIDAILEKIGEEKRPSDTEAKVSPEGSA